MESGIRLYVLGPAWDLPSLDADCIAAIALSKSYFRGIGIPLTVIPSHHHEKGLPALQHGPRWVHGVNGIIRYIRDTCKHFPSPDSVFRELSPEQQAQATALTTLVQVQGQQVLDVHLYVSSDNYHQATRPAFTRILPWYANYLVPGHLRHAALSRTEHLGISTADPDVHGSVVDDNQSQPVFRALSLSDPGRSPARQRREELGRAFKLKAIADASLEPLDAVLGRKQYLIGDQEPTVVDCIAYGHLSLMMYARTSSSWARDALRDRYPRLAAYTTRLRERFAIDVPEPRAERLMRVQGSFTCGEMDWTVESPSRLRVMKYVLSDLLGRLPGYEALSAWAEMGVFAHRVVTQILPVGAVILLTAGWVVGRQGGLVRGEPIYLFSRQHGNTFGAAGEMLRGLDLGSIRYHSV